MKTIDDMSFHVTDSGSDKGIPKTFAGEDSSSIEVIQQHDVKKNNMKDRHSGKK
jgi:hypothetical protein